MWQTQWCRVAQTRVSMFTLGESDGVLARPSFAMIMIELYTGERLFKGLEVHQLMYLARSPPFSPFPQHVCCCVFSPNQSDCCPSTARVCVSVWERCYKHLAATPFVRSTT